MSKNKFETRRNLSRTFRVLLILVFLSFMAPTQAQWPGESGTFRGHWSFSGTIRIMEFGEGRKVAMGSLQGTIVIETSEGPIPSFETDGVFFYDQGRVGISRFVWKDTSEDEIYVEMESNGPIGFGKSRGTFVGGTGRFEGITGHFNFDWDYSVSGRDEARLDGHTVLMTGNYRLQNE